MVYSKIALVCAVITGGARAVHSQSIICADDGTYKVILDSAANQIYMTADQSVLSGMNEITEPFAEVRLDLSAECQHQTIYKSFFLGYADLGHPPIDPIGGGGWGVPHFDAHFNTKDAATIAGYTCKAGPVPVQCNQDCTTETCGTEAMEQLAKMNNLPAAEYITGFIVDASWGGHAVIGHGLHLVPTGDPSFAVSADPAFPDFDANCAGGPVCGNPSWVGCAAVTQGAPDIGCRYSKASLTSIAITYDGERIGEEAMFTREQVASMTDGQSVTVPYPQAESASVDQAGKLRALTTRVDIVGTKARIGFDLTPVPADDKEEKMTQPQSGGKGKGKGTESGKKQKASKKQKGGKGKGKGAYAQQMRNPHEAMGVSTMGAGMGVAAAGIVVVAVVGAIMHKSSTKGYAEIEPTEESIL